MSAPTTERQDRSLGANIGNVTRTNTPPTPRTRWLADIAATALLTGTLLTACASSGTDTAGRTTSTAAPPATSLRAPITLSEADNGRSVALQVGQHLRITLASTYWTFQPGSNSTVLHSDGAPSITPQPSGCVPGQGCGTVTAAFTARASGTAVVVATRTTCGEALACTPPNNRYQVTIKVT
jgi:hypothetical protein